MALTWEYCGIAPVGRCWDWPPVRGSRSRSWHWLPVDSTVNVVCRATGRAAGYAGLYRVSYFLHRVSLVLHRVSDLVYRVSYPM